MPEAILMTGGLAVLRELSRELERAGLSARIVASEGGDPNA